MLYVNCYIFESAEEQLLRKSDQVQVSFLEDLADLTKKDAATDWSEGFFELFGACQDDPLTRNNQGEHEQRLELN